MKTVAANSKAPAMESVSEAPRVHVTECLSAQWAVSPASGAVYVLVGSPSELRRRLDEALAAYDDLCSSRWSR